MRRRVVAVVLAVVLVVILAKSGLVLGPRPKTHIWGAVQGESLPGNQTHVTIQIAATVRCNGVAETTRTDGRFDLTVPPASHYTCVVTATSMSYAPQSATIPGTVGDNLELAFTSALKDQCIQRQATSVFDCGMLQLRRGAVAGIVRSRENGHAVANATVRCALASTVAAASQMDRSWPFATSDATGAYRVGDLPPGQYTCVADSPEGGASRQAVAVTPGEAAPLNFQVCGPDCDALHYHDGAVMHTFTAYLIFWLPPSYTLEPGVADATFEASIERYFRAVGGTAFYDLLTQYWDYAGPVRDSVTLGGVYVDTSPYEHCESAQNCKTVAADKTAPLLDEDIQTEVKRAATANPRWHADREHEFFVFTGHGAEVCFTSASNSECTWKGEKQGFCGYHSSAHSDVYSAGDEPYVYAYIADSANDGGQCAFSPYRVTPHGDNVLDGEFDTVSHEQFESVTDPIPAYNDPTGWYDDALGQHVGEIGDKCETDLGTIGGDGGNVTLGNGERYLLQAEWSNRANGCAFA